MSVLNFELTVTSTSNQFEHLMIILNPNLIANSGQNYQSYFPVAWKVLNFPSNSKRPDGIIRSPAPIKVDFQSDLTAVLQQLTSGNIVDASDVEAVEKAGDLFDVAVLQNIPYLKKDQNTVAGFTVSILNGQPAQYNVGLGDKDGNSYLTMPVDSMDTISFKYDAEFAVVPVGPTVEASKLVSGTVFRPWFSFKLSDVVTSNPSFTFDGLKIVNQSGINTIVHSSAEVVFGGSASGGLSKKN